MNKHNISQSDVKVFQIIGWFIATFSILIMSFILFLNFSYSAVFILIFSLALLLAIQYFNSKIWNVWYEGNELFFENIYKTYKRDLELFKNIEKDFFGNYYTLYLANGECFRFKIKPMNSVKLFFKNDSQFYATKMNEQLKDYIRTRKGHILLD